MPVIITSPFVKQDFSQVVLLDSPIAYYRLGEPSGVTANDSSGSGFHGTYVASPGLGAPGLIVNDPDTAVSFTAASNHAVNVNTLAAGKGTNTDTTVEAWFTTTASPGAVQIIFSMNGPSAPTNKFLLGTDSLGEIYLDVGSGPPTLVGSGYNDGNPHHVVATVGSAGAGNIYVDGALLAPHADSSVSWSSASLASIGQEYDYPGPTGGNFWDGVIDEVAIYDTILPLNRIQAHYNAGV